SRLVASDWWGPEGTIVTCVTEMNGPMVGFSFVQYRKSSAPSRAFDHRHVRGADKPGFSASRYGAVRISSSLARRGFAGAEPSSYCVVRPGPPDTYARTFARRICLNIADARASASGRFQSTLAAMR